MMMNSNNNNKNNNNQVGGPDDFMMNLDGNDNGQERHHHHADGGIMGETNNNHNNNNNNNNNETNANGNGKRISQTLRSLLRGQHDNNNLMMTSSTEQFFSKIWQQKAIHFPYTMGGGGSSSQSQSQSSPQQQASSYATGGGEWNDDEMKENPLDECVKNGWHILKHILEQAQEKRVNRNNEEHEHDELHPLIFHNQELKSLDEITSRYYGSSSLFASYLDGCSIVINHGDLLSPWIGCICEDLQNEFPHVYANCYITPPNSQAVPAHADDRDVLIIQLVGSKEWKVYKNVPIPYPYPHEQVGKSDGNIVPPQVLDGPLEISTTLHPGDVLYMPRGYVHEAKACKNTLSFHCTIALATHDWTLAGMVSMETQRIMSNVVDFRKSILPTENPESSVLLLQAQIDKAMKMLQEEITAESILQKLSKRLESHNRRAFPLRMNLVQTARFPPPDPTLASQGGAITVVGPQASKRVTYTSIIRAAASEERKQVMTDDPSRPRVGLHVREEIADSIMGIISSLKSDPNKHCRVIELRSLCLAAAPTQQQQEGTAVCDDLALLSLAKRGVELGALAVVSF